MTVHDPETCRCFECALIIYDRSQAAEEFDVKSKPPTVEVQKVRNNGEMPPFLGIMQRHWEKAKPTVAGNKATLVADLGMLEFMVPAPMIAEIESIEILYEKTK